MGHARPAYDALSILAGLVYTRDLCRVELVVAQIDPGLQFGLLLLISRLSPLP
jgi:hypothetical protein